LWGRNSNTFTSSLEAQYNELNEIVDDVAERSRALGGNACGTMIEFLKSTRLKEESGYYPEARHMLANLLADHEALICHLRIDLETCAEQYHDAGTNDFLTGLMEQHEKMAWMLRAFLEGK
jgi:starvation-inducible DNA-binding protein